MITIDDVEYKEDDLSDISKIHVERINELRQESTQIQIMLNEKKLLISAYANAIKQSVKPVQNEGEIVNE
mgnify:CR=1 FL=1